MNKMIKLYQCSVGGMDACTGFLLVFFPVWTLHLMGMTQIPEPADIISFVGIFVMAVGMSYFLVRDKDVAGWEMQWRVTGVMRGCVACFLTWKILGAGWEVRWATVLVTDIAIAVIQFTGLKKGWLGNGELRIKN